MLLQREQCRLERELELRRRSFPYPALDMAAIATTHVEKITLCADAVFVHILFRSWKQLKCSLLERLSKPLKGRKGKKA